MAKIYLKNDSDKIESNTNQLSEVISIMQEKIQGLNYSTTPFSDYMNQIQALPGDISPEQLKTVRDLMYTSYTQINDLSRLLVNIDDNLKILAYGEVKPPKPPSLNP